MSTNTTRLRQAEGSLQQAEGSLQHAEGSQMQLRNKAVVFMFSGQGSQYYQMGADLYQNNPLFKSELDKLDAMVKDIAGYSVIESLYLPDAKKSQPLLDIELSHPAIVMIEYALAKTLMAQGIKPDLLLGASLGEFTAAALAGVIAIEDVLGLVLHQANQLDFSQLTGAMIAVLDKPAVVGKLAREHKCELAGQSADKHCLVSGLQRNIESLSQALKVKKIAFQLLPVEYAFHSSVLDTVKTEVLAKIQAQSYQTAQLPLISCATAGHLTHFASDHLWRVIRQPIELAKTIAGLEQQGSYYYLDVSPSSTFSNFVKANLKLSTQSECLATLDPYGDDLARIDTAVKLLSNQPQPFKQPSTANTNQSEANVMNIYAFPGQGSQVKGMGAELFKLYPDLVKQADDILGYSIEQLCLKDSKKQLAQTQFTQPALYVVSALSYLAEVERSGKPDIVAGHSLGEYAALFAAGAFDFATGLRLVKKRGELMSQAKVDGGMAAVLNCPEDKIKLILEKSRLTEIDVANYNTPKQVVIAGPKRQLKAAEGAFKRAQANFVPLNVSAPFHSRYMAPVVEQFRSYLDLFQFQPLQIPVIANVTAQPYQFSDLKDVLASQISHSVKWAESIRYLLDNGAIQFKELGPGDVLTKMFAVINKSHQVSDVKLQPRLADAIASAQQHSNEQAQAETQVQTAQAEIEEGAKSSAGIKAEMGSGIFKDKFACRMNYLVGAVADVNNKDIVIKAAQDNILAYLTTEQHSLAQVSEDIQSITQQLTKSSGQGFGVALNANHLKPSREMELVELLLAKQVKNIAAKGFAQVTEALVYLRFQSLTNGTRLLAQVDDLQQAEAFLKPAPAKLVKRLVSQGKINQQQAEQAANMPIVDAIAFAGELLSLPLLMAKRERFQAEYKLTQSCFIGSSKAIGTPESIASALVAGADFVLSDSINLCTKESVLPESVKELLANASVEDICLTPSSELFEFGDQVSVLNKGSDYAQKANALYRVWQRTDSLDSLTPVTRRLLERDVFNTDIDTAYQQYVLTNKALSDSDKSMSHVKGKLGLTLLCKGYLQSLKGSEQVNNRQIPCGQEMAALNHYLQQQQQSNWQQRSVVQLADKLMTQAQRLLTAQV